MYKTSVCINSDLAQTAQDKSASIEQILWNTLSKAKEAKSMFESSGMSGDSYDMILSIMNLIIQYHEALANHFSSHTKSIYELLKKIDESDSWWEIQDLRSL